MSRQRRSETAAYQALAVASAGLFEGGQVVAAVAADMPDVITNVQQRYKLSNEHAMALSGIAIYRARQADYVVAQQGDQIQNLTPELFHGHV